MLTTNDLVTSDNCFFAATGITDGKLLRGVRYSKNVVTTQSLVMRSSSGTVRTVEAEHRLSRLREILSHTKSPEEQYLRRAVIFAPQGLRSRAKTPQTLHIHTQGAAPHRRTR